MLPRVLVVLACPPPPLGSPTSLGLFLLCWFCWLAPSVRSLGWLSRVLVIIAGPLVPRGLVLLACPLGSSWFLGMVCCVLVLLTGSIGCPTFLGFGSSHVDPGGWPPSVPLGFYALVPRLLVLLAAPSVPRGSSALVFMAGLTGFSVVLRHGSSCVGPGG